MPLLFLFIAATTLPIPLIGLGAVFGGWWIASALIFMTGLTFTLDTLVKVVTPPARESEFPGDQGLLVVIAVSHFPLLAAVVYGLSHDTLSIVEKVALFLAAGLYFGQVGNSNAHELIHRSTRGLHRLGMWVYISLLFGHHTSAHVLVHHRHVATNDDPSSAKLGESYYRFAYRAWVGSFYKGYLAENERFSRLNRPALQHPYVLYCSGAVMMMIAACLVGGAAGIVSYICIALYATSQLLLSDYVQHYGLRRAVTKGKAEPVNARHSWDSPHWFSSALMLNAPRHSNHHAHPTRPFPALELPENGPTLPRSLPAMATLALFPTLWRRVMDHRAKRWQN